MGQTSHLDWRLASRLEDLQDVTSGIKKRPFSQLHAHSSNSPQVLQAKIGVGDHCQPPLSNPLCPLPSVPSLPPAPFSKWRRLSCIVTKPRLSLCDPLDCSPPGSSVCGILQARRLEWVAMPSYRGSSQPRDWTQVSCIAGMFFTIRATREAQRLRVSNN